MIYMEMKKLLTQEEVPVFLLLCASSFFYFDRDWLGEVAVLSTT